uniref:Uncharacterized protein n=1 Tax=Meloidogyne enterolobii TaxID=390850 RepID=A0A6V7VRT8_MELEN|nr:unnamed protein product [Meloidogyne enterolobii]
MFLHILIVYSDCYSICSDMFRSCSDIYLIWISILYDRTACSLISWRIEYNFFMVKCTVYPVLIDLPQIITLLLLITPSSDN